MVSDWRNFETWAEAASLRRPARRTNLGGVPRRLRATGDGRRRRDELEAFVARRVAEGGVATDF